MAKTVESFEFGTRKGKYQWDKWFDGQIWQLERGKDFTITAYAFAATARQTALRNGGTAQAACRGDIVTLQFMKTVTP